MLKTSAPEDAKSRTGDKLAPLLGFLTLILLFATLSSLFLHQRLAFGIFLVLGIASLTAFVLLSRGAVFRFFVSRQARYGANVGVSVLLVIGIAVIVNVIVAQRFDTSADWTADKIYTLSDQTKKILRGLDREVRVIAFFSMNSADEGSRSVRELLEIYRRETDKLHIEFVDPVADALKFQEYEIQFDGTTVFESGGVRERVTTIDEQKFTSAILKVVRDEVKKIYFLTGHEERSIDDFDRVGYNQASEELEKQNYKVESLILTTQSEIPVDCVVLIIPGPKAALTPHEVNAISRYLDSNGKLFLLLDPLIASAEDPNQPLIDLMDRWGVTVGNDYVLVLDPRFQYVLGGPAAPVVLDFEFHQITRFVAPTIFQIARSVTLKERVRPDLNIKSLAKTIDQIGVSWGETKRKDDGTFESDPVYTEGEDTPPPVSLAIAVEFEEGDATTGNNQSPDAPKETKTRIVVVGDSDFASNAFFKSLGGGTLFLNAVNWLTLEEDLIAIRPIDPSERSLRLLTGGEVAFVRMVSIFLIPLIIFLIGVGVWWRRR